MKLVPTSLDGVVVLEPRVFPDDRGLFFESWNARRYEEHGLPGRFVQDNISHSRRGVLRGLHFQNPSPQGKLVSVMQGEVFDVAVDIRVGSPTFGSWEGIRLSAENFRQLYVPPGFAHGFAALSEHAVVYYKCTDFYVPDADGGIRWDDPDIGIKWPVDDPILSEKDASAMSLEEYAASDRAFRVGL